MARSLTALLAATVAAAAGAQTPIPPTAKDFAMAAVQSDQYEIQAAHLAIAQSRNASIRAFAQSMIDAHMGTSADIETATRASGLPTPPPAMSSDQAALLAGLQGLRGADFDKAYINQQVLVHTQALAVETSYAAEGGDARLRAAARGAVPLIQHHLEMAQQIKAVLGG